MLISAARASHTPLLTVYLRMISSSSGILVSSTGLLAGFSILAFAIRMRQLKIAEIGGAADKVS
jgi:hypothetical protein